jgi:hypothetical protein
MKPLVLWCRWHDAKLRLQGRSERSVWGELSFPDRAAPFHFDLATGRLTYGDAGAQQAILLDEMGVAQAAGGS